MRRFPLWLVALLLLAVPAFADCTTPAGYTRWGSSAWRVTEKMPGSPPWARLPTSVPADISADMRSIGQMSTGIGVHITSNTDTLRVCWELSAATQYAPIWSPTGMSGIDVYYRSASTAGKWRWLGAGEAVNASNNEVSFPLGFSEAREFLIYMPQNRAVSLVRIETPSAFTVSAGPAPTGRPVVVLGSSITQGSGTSRAGIAYPQALGRHLGVDTINLGFAGSCQMFAGMASLMASIDASMFVINCFPNMSDAQITAQMYTFLDTLADARPTTPIYVLQDRLNQGGGPHPSFISVRNNKEAAALTEFQKVNAEHPNVVWLKTDSWLGGDFEATVDGSHLSDLGHSRWLQNFLNRL